jgi:DNA-binding XRE family transcriptional regulator
MAEEHIEDTSKKKHIERKNDANAKKELVNIIRNECGDDVAEAFAKTAGCSVESGIFVRSPSKEVFDKYYPLVLDNKETITRLANSIGVKDVSYFKNQNIVKRTCKELGITQKELAERLDVPQPTMARWATGEIPEQSKKLLELFLENIKLKNDLRDTAKALKILDKIKGYE